VQTQRPVLRQVQKLKMTPQLYQAVRLMALPLQELKVTIEEELEKNPALQVEEDRSTVSLDSLPAREGSGEGDWFDHTSDQGYSRADAEAASDARRQFIEGALSQPESLQDHLLSQLALQPIPEEWIRIGELLIRNLDENGFHQEPLEVLLAEPAERKILTKVLALIQGFDPVGTCVKDVKESLLVQIRHHPDPHPRAAELVENWLEALEKQRHREIEKGMRISEARLKEIAVFIRTLDPLPGRNFSRDVTRYVLPDVQVTLHDGEFVIVLNDEMIPVLGINPVFEDMAKKKNEAKDTKTRQFVTRTLQDARWFIRTIGQRNQTLLKVCRAVVEFQREFFLKGPKYLKPLTLKDVAGEIGVHEATVSRITSSKYMQTEWGIFSLKHFFSNSVAGTASAGPRFSKEGVKEIIREIIAQEAARTGATKTGGLSDQKIVEILASKGVSLARRTVAKYRGELAIESSYQRRRT
jgi:RNA polymerase sigma-54 factor